MTPVDLADLEAMTDAELAELEASTAAALAAIPVPDVDVDPQRLTRRRSERYVPRLPAAFDHPRYPRVERPDEYQPQPGVDF